MVSQDHDLSQRRQCTLLQLSRSTLYYRPKGESVESKADQKTIRGIVFRRTRFMEIIDNQFLETPWYGSRQMARHMERQGHKCGRRHAEKRASGTTCASVDASDARSSGKQRPTLFSCPPHSGWSAGSCIWWPSWIGIAYRNVHCRSYHLTRIIHEKAAEVS
ncbi:hypothetical protein ABIE58_002913 [Roseovarius sp. MBR-78]